jgi:hypothetical protein
MSISQGFSAKTKASSTLAFRQASHARQVAAAKEAMENESLPANLRRAAKREYNRLTKPDAPRVDGAMEKTIVPPERIARTEQHREVAVEALEGFEVSASHEYGTILGIAGMVKVTYSVKAESADEAWLNIKVRRPENLDTLRRVLEWAAALETDVTERVALDAELLDKIRNPTG